MTSDIWDIKLCVALWATGPNCTSGPLHLSFVPSKSSNSATGPNKALKCVWTFSHNFFVLYAEFTYLHCLMLSRNSCYGRTESVMEMFPRTSLLDVLI